MFLPLLPVLCTAVSEPATCLNDGFLFLVVAAPLWSALRNIEWIHGMENENLSTAFICRQILSHRLMLVLQQGDRAVRCRGEIYQWLVIIGLINLNPDIYTAAPCPKRTGMTWQRGSIGFLWPIYTTAPIVNFLVGRGWAGLGFQPPRMLKSRLLDRYAGTSNVPPRSTQERLIVCCSRQPLVSMLSNYEITKDNCAINQTNNSQLLQLTEPQECNDDVSAENTEILYLQDSHLIILSFVDQITN